MGKLARDGVFVGNWQSIANYMSATITFPCGKHGTQIAKGTFKDGRIVWGCPECYAPKPTKQPKKGDE